MVQGCFKEVLRVFQERFRGVPKDLQGRLKGASRVSKQSSKGVSRQLQRCFKEVSREFKENIKCVSRKFQKKNVSMMCCFAILLFHGSHRSYPGRRRACYGIKRKVCQTDQSIN